MSKYNSNLAAEFYVLSILYRIGLDASLTLGNKKAVDIIIVNEDRTITTIDVKGLAGSYDWPADNIHTVQDIHHYYVLLSFEGKMMDPEVVPSIWVIPSPDIAQFFRQYKTRVDVSRAALKEGGKKYKDAWPLLISKDIKQVIGI